MNLRDHRDRGIYRPKVPDFAFQFGLFGTRFEWSTETADERLQRFSDEPISIITGLAFAGAYDAVGLGIVLFAPPPWKPIGATMLAPGPSEVILFGIGYELGKRFEERVPDWLI